MKVYIHYDPQSGRIKGFYDRSVNRQMPNPVTLAPQPLIKEIRKEPARWIVDVRTKQVTQIESPVKLSSLPPRKEVKKFDVNDRTYIVDSHLLSNISLGLSICANKPDHIGKLWCINKDGDFAFLEHSKEDYLAVALAFESARCNANE